MCWIDWLKNYFRKNPHHYLTFLKFHNFLCLKFVNMKLQFRLDWLHLVELLTRKTSSSWDFPLKCSVQKRIRRDKSSRELLWSHNLHGRLSSMFVFTLVFDSYLIWENPFCCWSSSNCSCVSKGCVKDDGALWRFGDCVLWSPPGLPVFWFSPAIWRGGGNQWSGRSPCQCDCSGCGRGVSVG